MASSDIGNNDPLIVSAADKSSGKFIQFSITNEKAAASLPCFTTSLSEQTGAAGTNLGEVVRGVGDPDPVHDPGAGEVVVPSLHPLVRDAHRCLVAGGQPFNSNNLKCTLLSAISCFFEDCSSLSSRSACAHVVAAAKIYSPDHWVFNTLHEKVDIISSADLGYPAMQSGKGISR